MSAVERRRERVAQLWREGMQQPEIAEQLGVASSTIAMDIYLLRVMGQELPFRRSGQPDPEVTKRRRRTAQLWREGYMAREIADRLGASLRQVEGDVRWLNLTGATDGERDPSGHPARRRRREQVVERYLRGHSPERIAEALGIARSTVYEDLAKARAEGQDVPHRVPSLSREAR